MKAYLLMILLALFTLGLSACGQKGPLEVDQPPEEPAQEEVIQDTN